MDKRKRNIIIIILCILIVIIALVILGIFYFDNDETINLLLINDKSDNDIIEDVNISEESKVDNIDKAYENEIYTDSMDTSNNINSVKNDDEEDVIEYFENMESEVRNSSSFKEKFKEYFTTIIDFIFYDKEIKGYTFKELSGTAKAKVVGIALKIDSKIEEYVPNYKESISSTYSDIKEKLVTLYMDIATDICKNNEEECSKVKDIFTDIKSTCKIGWDFVKSLIGNGLSKIKEWYEIYSGK